MKLLSWWLEQHFNRKMSLKRITVHYDSLGTYSLTEIVESKNTKPQIGTNGVVEQNDTAFEMPLADYEQEVVKVKVSCVQRKIRPVAGIEEYMDMLDKLVREAAESSCKLIVFPEYNFLDLLGLIPGFRLANRFLERRALRKLTTYSNEEISTSKGTGLISPMLIFEAIAEPIEKGLELIFARLARRYNMYIYTGSYITKSEGKVFNSGSLFSPEGRKLGTQKKLHLTELESQLGFGRDATLQIHSLPIGRVAYPVCMDATYFETFQIASVQGAEIILLPIANPEEYNVWKALKGIWPRVQEAYLYGVKASLTGWFAGMHYTGKAGIFAPIEITAKQDGVVAIADHYEGDQLVTAELDLALIRRARAEAEYFGDQNPEYEMGYVERVYYKRGGSTSEE